MSAGERAGAARDVDSRKRLEEKMNESRVRQGFKWNDVAARGNISVPTLRRIRHEHDYPLTEEAKRAIEKGLGWLGGDVERVLAGGTYTELTGVRSLDPRKSPVEEYVAALIALRSQNPDKYERVLARIDVVRAAQPGERPQPSSS